MAWRSDNEAPQCRPRDPRGTRSLRFAPPPTGRCRRDEHPPASVPLRNAATNAPDVPAAADRTKGTGSSVLTARRPRFAGELEAMADPLIAAIAKTNDLCIVTPNTKHFLPFGVQVFTGARLSSSIQRLSGRLHETSSGHPPLCSNPLCRAALTRPRVRPQFRPNPAESCATCNPPGSFRQCRHCDTMVRRIR